MRNNLRWDCGRIDLPFAPGGGKFGRGESRLSGAIIGGAGEGWQAGWLMGGGSLCTSRSHQKTGGREGRRGSGGTKIAPNDRK